MKPSRLKNLWAVIAGDKNSRSYALACAIGATCAICLTCVIWAQALISEKFVPQGDLLIHLRWAHQFVTALHEGVFLPRWAYASHGGLGDPTFLYYQPMFYYVTALMGAVGLSENMAFIVAAMVPSALAGIIVFTWLARNHSFARAMLGMTLAVTCPILFFLSTQHAAFPWVMSTPFCILFALESAKNRPDQIRVGIWLSLLCLSHLLSAFMMLSCLSITRVLNSRGHYFRASMRQWLCGVTLGLCLAAFFVYPAITQQNLINPAAWVNSPELDWHRAFAFSTFTYVKHGMRWFLIQWPFAIVALAMIFLVLAYLGGIGRKSSIDPNQTETYHLAITALMALFLSSELAYPLYALLPPFQKLQWPYRYVAVASVIGTTALSKVITLKQQKRRENWLRFGYMCLLAIHFSLVMLLQWGVYSTGKPIPTSDMFMQGDFGQPEYLTAQRGPHWRDYNDQGQLMGECNRLALRCEVLFHRSHSSRVKIVAPRETTARLPVFAFPGWTVVLDGVTHPLVVDPDTGLVSVTVPQGVHVVAISWTGTSAERIGIYISVTGAALLFGLLLMRSSLVIRIRNLAYTVA